MDLHFTAINNSVAYVKMVKDILFDGAGSVYRDERERRRECVERVQERPEQEHDEIPMIPCADALSNPRTMMVELHARSAPESMRTATNGAPSTRTYRTADNGASAQA